MTAEERSRYLKYLVNAGRLLAEKPFVHNELISSLHVCIYDKLANIADIFPVLIEAGLSDRQMLELLNLDYDYDFESILEFIGFASWDINRVWQALDGSLFEDEQKVILIFNLYKDLPSLVARMKAGNWEPQRIVRSLVYGDCDIAETMEAYSITGCNDFVIIELLRLHFPIEDIISAISDWNLERKIRALDGAGYGKNFILEYFQHGYTLPELLKVATAVWADHWSVIKIMINYRTKSEIVYAIENDPDFMGISRDIVEQLNLDSDRIAKYLEDGYLDNH
ncbi:MAG: hypothetical protein Q7K65_05935 [Candidatus Buchananbacteria bacterium]|nr:hypothetical protein [Candidatus Buchananbacteria bacterium]